jgi:excisionase family DNA binding protein
MQTNSEKQDHRRVAFSVAELAAQLGVSEGLLRLEIQRGRLKPARVGRRLVIMKPELDRYLADARA